MKKTLHYILALNLLLGFACRKKEYPKPVPANESVFYGKLLVDGQPLNIDAGKNGYYMYTSYSIDSSDVYNLVGEFKQTGCTTCTNTLRIQVNDSKVSFPNYSINIDSLMKLKNFDFLEGINDLGYSVNFAAAFNQSASSVLWDFGDGTTSTDLNPNHIFRTGKHKVTLTMTSPGNCQSVLTQTLSLTSANDLNAFLSASTKSDTVTFTSHIMGGRAPYTYLWDFGDGKTSTTPVGVVHAYGAAGNYVAKLKVTDGDGNTTTCYYNTNAGGSSCTTNFSFSNIISTGKRLGQAKVSIQYTDAKGDTFTSDSSLQPAISLLQIISVEGILQNEKNQAVVRVKLKFNCTLYNGPRSVFMQGTEVVIGFAYK